jgi:acylphosphatase
MSIGPDPKSSPTSDPAAAGGTGVVKAHWIVAGRVQGVGFRWFVRQQARRWGLRGWVRNRTDGSVEIAAAGPSEAIDGLLAAVRRGPDGAVVSEVRPLPEEIEQDLADPFSILRG